MLFGKKGIQFVLNILNKRFQKGYFKAFFSGLFVGLSYKMKRVSLNNNFDILRLTLAILVFFAHWNILTSQELSNSLFHLSGFAVDMFFVVSGFLIFWSFDADQNKKHFYIKRFFRIFPLYAFLIILQTFFFIGFSSASFLLNYLNILCQISFSKFLSTFCKYYFK